MARQPQSETLGEFMTIAEVAALLSLHPSTIWRYVRDGEIKALRIGHCYRIRRTDFEAMLVASEVTPSRAVVQVQITDEAATP